MLNYTHTAHLGQTGDKKMKHCDYSQTRYQRELVSQAAAKIVKAEEAAKKEAEYSHYATRANKSQSKEDLLRACGIL